MVISSKDADIGRAGADLGGGVVDAPSAVPSAPAAPERDRSLAGRLLDGSATGMLARDPGGIVRSANEAALRMLPGVRVGELLPPELAALAAGPRDPELTLGGRRLTARRQELADGWLAWHVTDVTDAHQRLDTLLAERARSRFLAAASRRLGLSLHPGRTAKAVVELASERLADGAVVVLPGRAGESEWFACAREARPWTGSADLAAMPQELRDALAGAATGSRPMLAEDLAGQPWAARLGSAAAAAIVTLPGNGHPAGALVLLRREVDEVMADVVDTALTEEFSQRAGLALAAAALYAAQAGTAAVLKRSLQQPELPEVRGMTFGAAYRPAEEGLLIGGDFYDVHVDPAGGSATFVLGDVCGKGVHAAVSTGRLRHSVQALRRVERDPVALLRLLNDTMLDGSDPDAAPAFATMVLGSATPRDDGGVRLQLAGGGHLPPLVLRRDGVEEIEIGGMLVGAVPAARFEACTVDLAPGESCVLYTDGVVEARGGTDGLEVLGEERLAQLLVDGHLMPAQAIAERIEQHAVRWLSSGAHDDIAVLVVRAPGVPTAPDPVAVGRHLHSVRTPDDVAPEVGP
ncbi:MAG: SpoIIE family protein phosphatase [Pseudonocardia sp.]|nr:SpoIIE family protein phosphatase [Pseudonocardia sp.]